MITCTTGTDEDNLGFTGKRLDGTGLSYFGARYYDAEIGRFISRDPAFDGRNWFVYCANNPLIYVDPNGETLRLVGSNKEQILILRAIQGLTDDALEIVKGEVVISYRRPDNEVKRPGGTSLVRQIVDNSYVATVKFGLVNDAGAYNWDNAAGGIGSHFLVHFSLENAKYWNTNSSIAIGHEFIHVLRGMLGISQPYNSPALRISNPLISSGYDNGNLEEYITTGLYLKELSIMGITFSTITDFNGNVINENILREENKYLPLRWSYGEVIQK